MITGIEIGSYGHIHFISIAREDDIVFIRAFWEEQNMDLLYRRIVKDDRLEWTLSHNEAVWCVISPRLATMLEIAYSTRLEGASLH